MRQLTIEPMFRDALPKLTEKEFQQLEENILEAGEVREPLIVWHNTIIDGHNRYEIVQKHPGIPFKVKQMEFTDQWDAIDWMCRNQLGKRNLTDAQKEYTLGKLYEARKHSTGGLRNINRDENGQFTTGGEKGHLWPSENKTRDIIAEEQNVSPHKVKSAYEFSRSVDAAEEAVPGFREKALLENGNRKAIRSMIRMDDEERKEAAEAILRGEYVAEKKPNVPKKVGNDEPYNADDFRLELSQFAPNLDSTIQMTLNMHGEMLEKEVCRMDFNDMLDAILAVVEKYKEAIKE